MVIQSFGKLKRINMNLKLLINPLLIICVAVVLRLVPHPANVAPIAAMALFGGVYFNKKYALLVPLAALFVSDLFLGFHASMLMVYTSFVLTGIIGIFLSKHKKVRYIVAGSLVSSLLFYTLTNFNYWYATPLYPKTISGLLESYVAALPFLRNTVLGDMLYTGLFFGSYEVMKALVNQHTHVWKGDR